MNMLHAMMTGIHEGALNQALRHSRRTLAWAGSWTCVVMLGFFAFVASTRAYASDFKSYPATSCRQVFGSQGILGGSLEPGQTARWRTTRRARR